MKYYLKVTCYTPKNKAEKCMKEWKKQFPTFKKPIKSEIVNPQEFYWIYEFDKEKDMLFFNKKVLLAEGGIKKVYRFMLKFFKRANKLLNKSVWTTKKVKRWLINRWDKVMAGNKEEKDKIDNMSEVEFKEHLKMEDEADIREFLEKEVIVTEFLSETEVELK